MWFQLLWRPCGGALGVRCLELFCFDLGDGGGGGGLGLCFGILIFKNYRYRLRPVSELFLFYRYRRAPAAELIPIAVTVLGPDLN